MSDAAVGAGVSVGSLLTPMDASGVLVGAAAIVGSVAVAATVGKALRTAVATARLRSDCDTVAPLMCLRSRPTPDTGAQPMLRYAVEGRLLG